MENSLSNPIMNGSKYYSDETSVVNVTLQNVSKYFRCVYVLVKKTDEQIPINFYMKDINEDIFKQMTDKLLIWKTSIDIIKNEKHFDKTSILNKTLMEPFNQFNFDMSNNILILPILNISFKNLFSYLNNIEGSNLDKIYNLVVLSKYFDDDLDNIKNQLHLQNVIKNMEESNYWKMPYNCLSNLTKEFKYRKFHNSFRNKMKETNLDSDTRDNYLDMIFKTSKYVDASAVIEKSGYKLYNLTYPTNFTKEDITNLFSTLDEKNRYYLFSNLMVSKKYCHLVVNNENILGMMTDELKSKAPLFRYLMGYSWLRFYFEESIKKRNLKITDDIIFDINTASKLPVYPFSINFPKMNPYMPIMVDDKVLNAENNIGGLKDYKYTDSTTQYQNQGICNLNEFKRRLNLFVNNNPENDLFNEIEWSKWKVAIGGSIMSACLPKQHKLVNMFSEGSHDDKLIRYFNEYYASSDIDVMFGQEDIFDYLEAVNNFHNQIVVNTCIIHSPYAEPEHIKLKQLFQIHFCVNEEWVKKNITNQNITFDFVFKNIEEKDVQSLFIPFIEESYKKYIEKQTKELSAEKIEIIRRNHPDYFQKLNEYDIKIHISLSKESSKESTEDNKSDKDSTNDTYQKYNELKVNYKYRIVSPYFNHPLEIFKITGNDHMGAVSQFHLPCVRAFYNGSNVYMTPSCISAHLTYMNIDYKYFSGSKDPIEIINKNRMRGFGTWLNENEIKNFIKYSSQVPTWANLYGKNNSNGLVRNLGGLSFAHKIFHPRLINVDEYYDAPPVNLENGYNDNYEGIEIKNVEEMSFEYLNKFKINTTEIDMTSFTTIKHDGFIAPLEKWIIDAYYNYSKMNNKLTKDSSGNNTNPLDPKNLEMPPLISLVYEKVNVVANN